MFSRTALSLRCVCVQAGRRRALDACFFAVFHGSGGAVDENVMFSRVFARVLRFCMFFRCFCIPKSAEAFPHVLPRLGGVIKKKEYKQMLSKFSELVFEDFGQVSVRIPI